MNQIQNIFDFIMDLLGNVANLYTTNLILSGVLALFCFGKLINIIRRVLPHG